ncbi:metastasis suppressor protein 1-like protein [Sarcoptes scabiei]|uniref:Metastasis suppressor protein 1-like protein n=1 Tax=Sarcoptes scabiei TaxID=52283 RepID=A0A132AGV8_SARSC|nr:metastasis suppressor protein 1-like protein [Sarcoptes scabiei]
MNRKEILIQVQFNEEMDGNYCYDYYYYYYYYYYSILFILFFVSFDYHCHHLGGTKEIGSALTRLCLRNRSVEAKLKSLNNSLLDSFISPLQDRVDEWKKLIVQLDKEHGKEIKRLKQFRKKQNNINDQIRDREMSTATLSSATTLANVHTFRMRKHHHHSHHQRNKNGKNDVPRIGSMYEMDKCSMSESSSSTTTNANPSQQQSLSSATSMSNIDSAAFSKEKFLMIDDVERNYLLKKNYR